MDNVKELLSKEIEALNYKLQIAQCCLGFVIHKKYPEKELTINFKDLYELFDHKYQLIGEQEFLEDDVSIHFKILQQEEVDHD